MENDIKNERSLILTHTSITNIFCNQPTDMEELLKSLKTYKYLKEKDFCGYTLLHHTVERGLLRESEIMLDHGIDINAQDHWGYTALHKAAELGYYHIIKLLLNKSADPNIKDKYGAHAFSYATFSPERKTTVDRLQSYQLLLNCTESTDEYISGEFIALCAYGLNDFITLLLKKYSARINIDFINGSGKNAVQHASSMGHLNTVKLLLSMGANTYITDQEGYDVVQIAKTQQIADLIKKHRISENISLIMCHLYKRCDLFDVNIIRLIHEYET
jgi:ankyrin repeat protein